MSSGKKFFLITGSVIVLFVVVFLIMMWTQHNGMVGARNNVDKAWNDVEAVYQRRLDTIPKFAKTAQFSVDFQRSLALDYAAAREHLKEAVASGDPAALQSAGNEGFNTLLIAVRQEAVPEAKLDQLTELNAEIENIERVINHERAAYNGAVRDYNNKIQKFPGNMFAGMFGFEAREGFVAQVGAEQAPDFDFTLN